jgi:aryl-alcohol dehydrogenase-like predicted oxidoreductase
VSFCPPPCREVRPTRCSPAGWSSRRPARLGVTLPQVALQWLLQLAPNVLLIPGTGSTGHLRENLAAEQVALDYQALPELARVGVWPG